MKSYILEVLKNEKQKEKESLGERIAFCLKTFFQLIYVLLGFGMIGYAIYMTIIWLVKGMPL